jgi:hypothetical protein
VAAGADDPPHDDDSNKALKRPAACPAATAPKMKKPAAAFMVNAYKYKYHGDQKWGIKFRGKEFLTVRDSVQQRIVILQVSFMCFHCGWVAFCLNFVR